MQPFAQAPPGVGGSAVCAAERCEELHGSNHAGGCRIEEVQRQVGVRHADHRARPQHAMNLTQRLDRIVQVLDDSMDEGAVERLIVEGQGIRVRHHEEGIRDAERGRVLLRSCDAVGILIHAHGLRRGDSRGQADGDAPRSATEVEQAHARLQMRKKKRGVALGIPPPMR